MTAASVGTSELWPGVFVAGVLWEILQLVGGYYIGHVFKHATSTYGTFGLVIALLVWLHLGAQVTLYAAEINVVVSRSLWPRSLLGPPDRARRQGDADRAGQGRGAPRAGADRRRLRGPDRRVGLASYPSRARRKARGRGPGASEQRVGDSRRVMASGHEHSPPSAGQPAHSPRCGVGLTANSRRSTPAASASSSASSSAGVRLRRTWPPPARPGARGSSARPRPRPPRRAARRARRPAAGWRRRAPTTAAGSAPSSRSLL